MPWHNHPALDGWALQCRLRAPRHADVAANFPARVYENAPDLVEWLFSEMMTDGVKLEIEAFDLP